MRAALQPAAQSATQVQRVLPRRRPPGRPSRLQASRDKALEALRRCLNVWKQEGSSTHHCPARPAEPFALFSWNAAVSELTALAMPGVEGKWDVKVLLLL